jgi:hypothetical protein
VLAQLPSDADAEKRLWTYCQGAARAHSGPDVILPSATGGLAAEAGQPRPLAARVPAVTGSMTEFLERRGRLERPRGLHPLMQYEAINFADGRRTVAEIFDAVSAEADSAGAWYYGTVDRADIERLFESAAKVGLVSLKN